MEQRLINEHEEDDYRLHNSKINYYMCKELLFQNIFLGFLICLYILFPLIKIINLILTRDNVYSLLIYICLIIYYTYTIFIHINHYQYHDGVVRYILPFNYIKNVNETIDTMYDETNSEITADEYTLHKQEYNYYSSQMILRFRMMTISCIINILFGILSFYNYTYLYTLYGIWICWIYIYEILSIYGTFMKYYRQGIKYINSDKIYTSIIYGKQEQCSFYGIELSKSFYMYHLVSIDLFKQYTGLLFNSWYKPDRNDLNMMDLLYKVYTDELNHCPHLYNILLLSSIIREVNFHHLCLISSLSYNLLMNNYSITIYLLFIYPIITQTLNRLISVYMYSNSSSIEEEIILNNNNDDEEQQQFDSNPDLICSICYEYKKTILFLPCNHCMVCRDCSSQLDTCPYCRKPIERKKNIFIV